MKKRKLLVFILTMACACLASASLTGCDILLSAMLLDSTSESTMDNESDSVKDSATDSVEDSTTGSVEDSTSDSVEEEHTHNYKTETINPTCEEKGLITYTCACGDSYTEELAALGHNEKTYEAQAPTCTEDGWEAYVACQREGCGYSTYVEIAALGHEKIAHQSKEPTCTEDGWNVYITCEREGCEYTTYEALPATHNKSYSLKANEDRTLTLTITCLEGCGYREQKTVEGEVVETPATCFSEGSIIFSYVAENGETLVDKITLPIKGHSINGVVMDKSSYPYNTPGITELSGQKATCTSNGRGIFTCDFCKELFSVVTTKEHSYENKQVLLEPTCTEPGLAKFSCSECRASDETEEIPALGHDGKYRLLKAGDKFIFETDCQRCEFFGQVEVTEKVTKEVTTGNCLQPGKTIYSYVVNNTTYTVEEASSTVYHTLKGKLMTETEYPSNTPGIIELSGQKATCETKGKGIYTCDDCGELFSVVTTKSHSYKVEGVILTPTATATGTVILSCPTCESYEEFVLPTLTDEAYVITSSKEGFKTYTLDLSTYFDLLTDAPLMVSFEVKIS